MAETETIAPRTMAFEIMVPYTMGTLDKKRIGLTSKTCAKRKETVSARVVGAGIATRAATQGAGLQLSGRRGHCRATSGGPRLEGSCGQNAGAPKAGGGGQRTRAYAGGGGAGPLVRTQKRVPGSRSAHQTIGKCMKACAQTVAHARDDRVQGRRGAGQSDLCAESVRTRARVEGVCVHMRARGETLWSGRLTLATAGRCADFKGKFLQVHFVCLGS